MENSTIVPAHCHRICFERFTLLPSQRLLLRDDAQIRIGARALDILIALAARPGELVTKEELLAQVWPSTFVDVVGLRVHMTALRKILGDDHARLIRTEAGRGYRFMVPTQRAAGQSPMASSSTVSSPTVSSSTVLTRAALSRAPLVTAAAEPVTRQLPAAVTRLIGRHAFIDGLVEQLPGRRLITLVGPGGIGKTRVAVACAEAVALSYRDGVGFADLTGAVDPESVAAALAEALGVAANADNPLQAVLDYLHGREMLLVIDNCEHVVDAAAQLIESIITRVPGVCILATSREALRVLAEWVRVLPPLASPPSGATLSVPEAMTYPAVELFVERATAVQHGFRLNDADVRIVGDICRRLDGVALAIELAAAQVGGLGLGWLASHLDDRLWILNRSRRTAVVRHRTLTALLDWSYELLSEREQVTLRRVATFPGDFTLTEAIDRAADDEIKDAEVIDAVGGLVSKSLAMLDVSGPVSRFRLPETTRAYAFAKAQLADSGLRHAAG